MDYAYEKLVDAHVDMVYEAGDDLSEDMHAEYVYKHYNANKSFNKGFYKSSEEESPSLPTVPNKKVSYFANFVDKLSSLNKSEKMCYDETMGEGDSVLQLYDPMADGIVSFDHNGELLTQIGVKLEGVDGEHTSKANTVKLDVLANAKESEYIMEGWRPWTMDISTISWACMTSASQHPTGRSTPASSASSGTKISTPATSSSVCIATPT